MAKKRTDNPVVVNASVSDEPGIAADAAESALRAVAVDNQPPAVQREPISMRLRRQLTHLWALPAIIVLIAARAVQITPSPAEFPLDRNMTLANRIRTIEKSHAEEGGVGAKTRGYLMRSLPETPEMPLLPSGAWLLSRTGIHPIVAARIISLLASLAVGIGLYILGRRVAGALAGHLALWVFALDPFSIFMGRVLLPDGIMMAGIVWSFVGAGAGLTDWRWRRAAFLVAWLTFAILAKMPAAMIAPAAALALFQTSGWRRPQGWIAVAIAAVLVYGAMCWWYDIKPWAPKDGLRALSQRTNNVMASMSELWDDKALRVLGARLTLALTLPGVWLAAAGLAFVQARKGNRLWLNAWALLSVAGALLTLKANTYWAYIVVPAGSLLIGLALAEFWRWHPLTLLPVVLLSLAGLGVSPAAAKVKSYFALDPAYDQMARLLEGKITGPVLYYGLGPDDIQYFVNQPGRMLNPNQLTDEQQANFRESEFLLTHQMLGNPLLFNAFQKYPVIATLDQRFVLFELKPLVSLGLPEMDSTKTYPMNLPLADQLTVKDVKVELTGEGSAREVSVRVWYERGPAYAPPLYPVLVFIQQQSGLTFPLTPFEGGAYFKMWYLPVVQAPDFKDGPIEYLTYRYRVPEGLPDGDYALSLMLLREPTRPNVIPNPVVLQDALALRRPVVAADRVEFDVENGIWLRPASKQEPSWLGGQRTAPLLSSTSEVWLSSPMPAGKYTLAVTARGIPVGDTDRNRWPVINIKQAPKKEVAARMNVDSENSKTYEQPIDWKGPEDFINLEIGNSFFANETPDPFPLYLSETITGNRAVVLDKIELRKAQP